MKRAVVALLLMLTAVLAHGGRISDISNTKHNLSTSGPGTTKSTDQSQVCVFCHTPHAARTQAELGVVAPLWNRDTSSAAYTMYDSTSLDATDMAGEPTGNSKLCLSCHDGTIALSAVGVADGQANPLITMTSDDPAFDGTMPAGQLPSGESAETSGFTRRIGTDLRNDHPISFTYDTALASADGELRDPATATVNSTSAELDGSNHIRTRAPGDTRPLIPLDAGQLQCTSCHDPHIRDAGDYGGKTINAKFLRVNRFQLAPPTPVANPTQSAPPFTQFVFDPADSPGLPDSGDIICLACHDKAGWAQSAHARQDVADYSYSTSLTHGGDPTALRDFFPGIKVWQASCLNCHDTHTVQGSRRLLREGVGGSGIDRPAGERNKALIGAAADQSDSAVENTCFQCHSSDRETLEGQSSRPPGFDVPDIKSDFDRAYHMPLLTADQENNTKEVHSIADADFYEPPASLATLSAQPSAGRHAECTDCHNPHRVKRTQYFWEDPDTPGANTGEPTHKHSSGHSNLASGVLAGAYGVEPDYGSALWEPRPAQWASKGYYDPNDAGLLFAFDEKKGAPPLDSRTTPPAESDSLIDRDTATYVTREYQICMKCHSPFGYGNNPPPLQQASNGGSRGVNGFSLTVRETNQAMEFMAPDGSAKYGGADHRGEGTATGANWGVEDTTNNHRSWHPVVGPTGRDPATRKASANQWLAPFNGGVGTQTMYCSDCHGSGTAVGTSAPSGSQPWGPHGSDNPFILKGDWSPAAGATASDELCFRCHAENYRTGDRDTDSGFDDQESFGAQRGDLHDYHVKRIGSLGCNWCHVAVPHGWKNKAFLVNLNDVGPECDEGSGPLPVGTDRDPTPNKGYTCAPYYRNAFLRIVNWRKSGEWRPQDCGRSSSDNDVQWMTNTCNNPN